MRPRRCWASRRSSSYADVSSPTGGRYLAAGAISRALAESGICGAQGVTGRADERRRALGAVGTLDSGEAESRSDLAPPYGSGLTPTPSPVAP